MAGGNYRRFYGLRWSPENGWGIFERIDSPGLIYDESLMTCVTEKLIIAAQMSNSVASWTCAGRGGEEAPI